MSVQNPASVPEPPDGSLEDPDVETTEVDGRPVIDPDADDDRIDSAEADRLAAENGDAPEER